MKIISQCRELARRVYYGVAFEIKTEIPVERNRTGSVLVSTRRVERIAKLASVSSQSPQ